MYNEELCNLIWKRYNEHPSAHLYALWVAYKECSDFIGLSLFKDNVKDVDIDNELFLESYYSAYIIIIR